MHAPRLRELVAELFESHGFDVTVDAALEGRSGNYYTAPVLAEQTDYAVLIERRGQQETVTARDVAELANVVEDVGAEQGLLVHLGPLDDAARGAGAGRVILWDAITLTNLLGNARLAGATGYPLVRLPLEADVPVLESPTQVVGDDVLPAAFTDDSAFSIFDGPLVAEPQGSFEPDEDLVHFGDNGLADTGKQRIDIFTVAGEGGQTMSCQGLRQIIALHVRAGMTGDGNVVIVEQQFDIELASRCVAGRFSVIAFLLGTVAAEHDYGFAWIGFGNPVDITP